MTKRFTISNHCRIKDETQIGFFNIANNIDAKRVCDLLNELNDENEQLKSKNRGLQSELQIFKKDVEHSNLQMNKLADENEQLKQTNQRLTIALKEIKEKTNIYLEMTKKGEDQP